MTHPPENRPLRISQNIYRRLLTFYPAQYRRDYGALMAQVFRDQCRDAARRDGCFGLIKVWCRVLPDLVKTAIIESFCEIERNMNMTLLKRNLMMNLSSLPKATLAISLFVASVTAIVTFQLPEIYLSTARVSVGESAGQDLAFDPYWIQTQLEILQSKKLLYEVIDELDLNRRWSRQNAGTKPLKTAETYPILKSKLDVRQSRNTSLIEIRAYSEVKDEAAAIANKVAEVYGRSSTALPNGRRVDLVDQAEPAGRPVRPNVPLNIVIGILAGLAIGTGMALFFKHRLRHLDSGNKLNPMVAV